MDVEAPEIIELSPRSELPASSAASNRSMLVDSESPAHASELPPVDRGRQAWGCLAGAFLLEAIFSGNHSNSHRSTFYLSKYMHTGIPYGFGVFQKYYSEQEAFANDKRLPLIGAIGLGLGYLGAPFVTQFTLIFPKSPKKLIYLGVLLYIAACISASFANTVRTSLSSSYTC